MRAADFIGKAAQTVLVGVVGAATFSVLERALRKVPSRELAVTGVAWSLRAVRRTERGAETARLKVGDIVAEARERIGEEATPPGSATEHHDHEH